MLCQFQVYSKVIQLCMCIYLFFFRFFSHLGYYRILSIVPCAIQQFLVVYLFYIPILYSDIILILCFLSLLFYESPSPLLCHRFVRETRLIVLENIPTFWISNYFCLGLCNLFLLPHISYKLVVISKALVRVRFFVGFFSGKNTLQVMLHTFFYITS